MVHKLFYFSFFLGLLLIYNLHKSPHLCNICFSDYMCFLCTRLLASNINDAVAVISIDINMLE